MRPDKLRFDFTHGAPLSAEEVRAIEDRIDVGEGQPAGAGARDGARRGRGDGEQWPCSARSAGGSGWSRSTRSHASFAAALTSPTPPRSGSSRSFPRAPVPPTCAGSRRSSGPAAIDWYRGRADALAEAGELLGAPRDAVAGARRAAERLASSGASRSCAARRPAPRPTGSATRARRSRGPRRRRARATAPTSASCSSLRTASSSVSATRPSCSAAPTTARSPWSPASLTARSSAASPAADVIRGRRGSSAAGAAAARTSRRQAEGNLGAWRRRSRSPGPIRARCSLGSRDANPRDRSRRRARGHRGLRPERDHRAPAWGRLATRGPGAGLCRSRAGRRADRRRRPGLARRRRARRPLRRGPSPPS